MIYYFCSVPVAPIRSEAAHRSEQVSQLLFGEVAQLLATSGDFIHLRVLNDGYEGWCQFTQLTVFPFAELPAYPDRLTRSWVTPLHFRGTVMNVPFGSSLGMFAVPEMARLNYLHEPVDVYEIKGADTAAEIVSLAFTYLNTSYQWGGRSVFGIDCSGFTQAVFRFLGVELKRDAWQQALQGESLGFLEEAKTGDLAFFDNEHGKITHVGILLDAQTIIHSSGKVRVDKMDNMGIISNDTGKRTHNLRIIKRLVNADPAK